MRLFLNFPSLFLSFIFFIEPFYSISICRRQKKANEAESDLIVSIISNLDPYMLHSNKREKKCLHSNSGKYILLICRFIRMWKSMLKSHRRQFRAIVESKTRNLRANTGFRGDSTVRTTIELEMELLNWCTRFSEWVNTQKSYVESLNKWLMHCLLHEPVETPDGIMPFSPSRIGAPTVFIISNDWNQAMERISETTVVEAMTDFVSNLHRLWERQDEEQKHRLKAEYLTKDFEKRLRTLRKEMGRLEKDHSETLSEKTAASIVPSESGVSPLDDLKVDLDSMRKRLDEERARHKESVKLVHSAASNSIQAGLIPIFEALENFTSEAVKAHEQVRVKGTVGDGS